MDTHIEREREGERDRERERERQRFDGLQETWMAVPSRSLRASSSWVLKLHNEIAICVYIYIYIYIYICTHIR